LSTLSKISIPVFSFNNSLVYSFSIIDWGWALAFAPNDKFIVSAALDDSLKFINFETKMVDGDDEIYPGKVVAMAISPNNELIIAASGRHLRGYNIKTKEKVFQTLMGPYGTHKPKLFLVDFY